MGFLRKLIVGRWFTRWLLRGGPWAVAAKLAGVALWGVWKWRRQSRQAERERLAREIPAEYEVIEGRSQELAARGERRDEPPLRDDGREPESAGGRGNPNADGG